MAHTSPPVSTRHAFALAFDLGVRRDLLHSVVVPLLLRSPWALAMALVSPLPGSQVDAATLAVASVALLGDFLMMLIVGSMLRFRAWSTFLKPVVLRPAPVGDCYARGIRRVPWLVVTEIVRNFSLGLAASFVVIPTQLMRLRPESMAQDLLRDVVLLLIAGFLALPALFLGFRLAVATEAVVLHEGDLAGAFQRSFRLMRGHFERWLELIALSATLVLGAVLVCSVASLAIPWLAGPSGLATSWLVVIGITPLIQYAWTFFYLRLDEMDIVPVEVGPTYAAAAAETLAVVPEEAAPPLELVPPDRAPEDHPA